MTTNYTENESSRKKYLAPLVVIMLCAVALTGAAYAYSTTVTGNGDIKANYVVIDMYSDTAGTTPTATLQYDVNKNMFQVCADTDKTSSTGPYVANVDDHLVAQFFTFLEIKTDISGTTNYSLAKPELEMSLPSGASGKLAISSQSVTINNQTSGGSQVNPEADGTYTLTGNTVYKVLFSVYFKGGYEDGTFGSFATLKDLTDAVDAYNVYSKELTVKFSASEKTTSTTVDSEGPTS